MKTALKFLLCAAASVIALALAACDRAPRDPNPEPTTLEQHQHEQQARELTEAADQYRKPSYAVKDGSEYGYARALTEQDKQGGVAGARLSMFRYFGRVGNKYQVAMRDGASSFLAEAEVPFQYAKVYQFVNDELVGTETLALQPDAILALVFKDAKFGNLDQYSGRRNGRNGHLIFDAQARRVVFIADN